MVPSKYILQLTPKLKFREQYPSSRKTMQLCFPNIRKVNLCGELSLNHVATHFNLTRRIICQSLKKNTLKNSKNVLKFKYIQILFLKNPKLI